MRLNYNPVFIFLNCECEETAELELRELSKRFNPFESSKNMKHVLKSLNKKLDETESTVYYVFDNLNKYEVAISFIKNLLPSFKVIMILNRNIIGENILKDNFSILEVKPFSYQQSRSFMQKCLLKSISLSEIEELIYILDKEKKNTYCQSI